MKRFLLLLSIFLVSIKGIAQNISGQWRGYFDDNGNISLYAEQNTEYVLELNINGEKVTGYSYTYFQGRQYFVICSLSGSYNKKTKSVIVTETARLKGNTPPMQDCLQTHVLTYKKVNGKEELAGTWKPAPGHDCGVGMTTLTRKTVPALASSTKEKKGRSLFSEPKIKPKPPKPPVTATKPQETVVQNGSKTKPVAPIVKAPEKTTPTEKEPVKSAVASKTGEEPVIPSDLDYRKRDNNILKTIEIDNPTFKVELYDNGDIDGDSISLFYNRKLLLSHKKLSTRAITLNLAVDDTDGVNELIMYAENLGEIPPNTALMIVTDGDNRYEVRITSDLQKSGLIRFVRKQK
ncbi:hypothetical protein ACQ33O_08090 [Ferruginibacter sp. SUN002]|uniref:hypothetical protein n=1 Tax=Ferruginibacter sp. SUN002 TaxID=2937789 RepID=UPI003D3672BF